MSPVLVYCYDAYCGWCYGFSPVIKRLAEEYQDQLNFEVLSGGMYISEHPRPISVTAGHIQKEYKTVEELTGVKFGEPFLWHIFHPLESDWFPNSEKPAIALCVFKEYHPNLSVLFAADLQYALNFEGRDLTDDEAYRHLLIKYKIPEDAFYSKMHSDEYKEKARYEFALCGQLQVTGFPTVLIQVSDTKFYLLSRGYSDFETMKKRIESVLNEVSAI